MTDDLGPGTPSRGEDETTSSVSPDTPPSSETAAPQWPPPASPPPPQWPPPTQEPVESGAPGLDGPSDRPDPLLVQLPDRAKQRRWTVLIRAILALPLGVVTFLLGIVAALCVIAGWFAALVIGRAPQFLRTILTIYFRLSLRLSAYVFLLTDRFPPFDFEEAPDDPVGLEVPPATRLNRAAVLFRLILVIPAYLVLYVVSLGIFLFLVFGWFASLITGWLPKPVHDAFRAFVRFQFRFNAYLNLLVPTYPAGLFGDEPVPPPPPWMPAENAEAVVDGPSESPGPASTSAPTPAPVPAAAPRAWNLVLGAGAKRVLLGAIVIGVAALVTSAVLPAVFPSQTQNQQALVQANNQLVGDFNQFASSAKSCTTVSCLEQANSVLSEQLTAFVSAVQGVGDSGVDPNAVSQVIQAAQNAEQSTAAMANAGSTVNAYQQAAVRVQLVQRLNALGTAQERFATAINNA